MPGSPHSDFVEWPYRPCRYIMTMVQRLRGLLIVGLLVSVGCSGSTAVQDAPYEYLAPARDIDVFFGLLEAADEEMAAALAVKDGVRASCHASPLNETKTDYLKHLRLYNAHTRHAAVLALTMSETGDPYFEDMLATNLPVDRLDGLTLMEHLVLLPARLELTENLQEDTANMTIPEWQMWTC